MNMQMLQPNFLKWAAGYGIFLLGMSDLAVVQYTDFDSNGGDGCSVQNPDDEPISIVAMFA